MRAPVVTAQMVRVPATMAMTLETLDSLSRGLGGGGVLMLVMAMDQCKSSRTKQCSPGQEAKLRQAFDKP